MKLRVVARGAIVAGVVVALLAMLIAANKGNHSSNDALAAGLPVTGPIDAKTAVEIALDFARDEGMNPNRGFISEMVYRDWFRTTGGEPGAVLNPDRLVWVVVFQGKVTPRIGLHPFETYDNFEVVLDKETGSYLGSGSRNVGVQPPFPLVNPIQLPR